MGGPLLIVNADDLGLRPQITGAIVECWRAGAISSATAMVHMEDTERAARLATAEGLPVGLHLNLTSPLTGDTVPDGVGAAHERLCRHFAVAGRRWLPDPRVRADIGTCVAAQLDEFRRRFGAEPTHVDGHEHIQCGPAVFTSRALRPVRALRLTHTFTAGERPAVHRAARALLNTAIRRRFQTTGRFWSLRDLAPELGGSGLVERLRTIEEPVEIMVHADWPDEQAVLLSPGWREATSLRRLGSYRDLPSR